MGGAALFHRIVTIPVYESHSALIPEVEAFAIFESAFAFLSQRATLGVPASVFW